MMNGIRFMAQFTTAKFCENNQIFTEICQIAFVSDKYVRTKLEYEIEQIIFNVFCLDASWLIVPIIEFEYTGSKGNR